MTTKNSNLQFTKNDTLALKGVAIQTMIFLHLFVSRNADYIGLLDLFDGNRGGYLLENQLSRCAGMCVSLYILLSGYGLYCSWVKNKRLKVLSRVLKLYVNFWVVALLFLPLGLILSPDRFSLTWDSLLNNLTGWHPTWNGEWWFLFPYLILVVVSKIIFEKIDRQRPWVVLSFLIALYLVSFACLKNFPNQIREQRTLWMVVRTLGMLFSFGSGALIAKYNLFARMKEKVMTLKQANVVLVLVLFLSVCVRSMIPNSIVDPFFGVWFICLFACLERPKWLNAILYPLGSQSTNMWLCHTFFCYYLFSEFIYGMSYAPVIFAVMVLLSYLTARLIDFINLPLQKCIRYINI